MEERRSTRGAGALTGQRDRLLRAVLRWLPEELRGRIDAEDVVQDVLAQGWRSLPRMRANDERTLRAWLRRTARNRIVDEHRRSGPRRPAGGEETASEARETRGETTADRERFDGLCDALEDLPFVERVAIVLRGPCEVSWEATAWTLCAGRVGAARHLFACGRRHLRYGLPPTVRRA